jgi:hypothetical protein
MLKKRRKNLMKIQKKDLEEHDINLSYEQIVSLGICCVDVELFEGSRHVDKERKVNSIISVFFLLLLSLK